MAQPISPISGISFTFHLLVLGASKAWKGAIHVRNLPSSVVLKGSAMGAVTLFMIASIFGGAQYIGSTYSTKNPVDYISIAKSQSVSQPATSKEVSAWIDWSNDAEALGSLKAHGDAMESILPLWYKLDSTGHFGTMYTTKKKAETYSFAKSKGIRIMPTIVNEMDPERVSLFLEDEDLQSAFTSSAIELAKDQGYVGYDLDWEALFPEDKHGLQEFLEQFASSLHEQGLQLSVSLPPPDTEISTSDASKAYDFDKVLSISDSIRIMAYDYHDINSDPSAVTPIHQLIALFNTLQKIKHQDKIVIGLPTYGYDWKVGTSFVEGLQYDQAIKRGIEKKINWQRDPDTRSLVGKYKENGFSHEIWLEDSESYLYQVRVAGEYGYEKFSIWKLGGEDSRIWQY